MTTAYWCVLVGALMPFVWTAIAKFGGASKMSVAQNAAPREYLASLAEGHQKRANWAQMNSFEAFPMFAAAVIISTLAGNDQVTIDRLAMLWVAGRVAYGICYLADWSLMRSLMWSVGIGSVVALFVTAS